LYPSDITKTIPYDCQVQPFRYIAPSIYINECFEKYNLTSDQPLKLFQPLSLRASCIPKYITLDTATLINFFAEKGTKASLLKLVSENQDYIWSTHFKLNKFTSKHYTFNYTLQTDGVGVSLLFRNNSIGNKKYGTRIKEVDNSIPYIEECSPEQLDILKTKKIVTADPGKLYLLYMMDDEGNELKYSCKQRDTESLAKRNRRIRVANKKRSVINHQLNPGTPDIISCETELSEYPSTTVDIGKFKAYIKKKHEVNLKVKSYYEKELNRKLIWRTNVYRKKSEDKFLNRIETQFGNKEDLVVCIGDWSAKHGSPIKGASTMGVGLKRLVKKRYTTLLVDEFNTSKKCSRCWKDISHVKVDGSKKFRLLKCKHCIGSPEDELSPMSCFFTRDKNSCLNMIGIIKHIIYKRSRPVEFTRGC
jgi:DNA-directed RNA polymerase subunit RPC12/RpoP